jgi:hypothetical protein
MFVSHVVCRCCNLLLPVTPSDSTETRTATCDYCQTETSYIPRDLGMTHYTVDPDPEPEEEALLEATRGLRWMMARKH